MAIFLAVLVSHPRCRILSAGEFDGRWGDTGRCGIVFTWSTLLIHPVHSFVMCSVVGALFSTAMFDECGGGVSIDMEIIRLSLILGESGRCQCLVALSELRQLCLSVCNRRVGKLSTVMGEKVLTTW